MEGLTWRGRLRVASASTLPNCRVTLRNSRDPYLLARSLTPGGGGRRHPSALSNSRPPLHCTAADVMRRNP